MIYHQPHNSLSNNYNANFYKTEIWKPHFHKSFEFVLVISGALKCCVGGEEYLLKKGKSGLCLPYDVHSYEPYPETEYWVCVFSEDYVHDFFKMTNGKTGSFKFECSPAVLSFLTGSLISGKNPSRLLIKAALYAVCDDFIKSVRLTDKKMSGNIAAITDFIEKNHTKNITLSDISKLLGYDYNYVSRYFNSLFGMSFSEFLAIYRLETAVILLEDRGKKILDVALESGFQSVRNFNCCFKKQFNMTPKEYRNSVSGRTPK